MNLTEFLLARITEDEEAARGALEGLAGSGAPWVNVGTRHLRYDNGAGESVAAIRVKHPAGPWERIYVKRDVDGLTAAHIARHDPARVLAECEAKRRIVEHYEGGQQVDSGTYACKFLALPYAGHPDYDPSWRP